MKGDSNHVEEGTPFHFLLLLRVAASGGHGQGAVGADDMVAFDDKGTGSHWAPEVKVGTAEED